MPNASRENAFAEGVALLSDEHEKCSRRIEIILSSLLYPFSNDSVEAPRLPLLLLAI